MFYSFVSYIKKYKVNIIKKLMKTFLYFFYLYIKMTNKHYQKNKETQNRKISKTQGNTLKRSTQKISKPF